MTKDFSPLALEVVTLDKIHALLNQPDYREGLTVGRISREIGVAVGYVQQILKRSECVLEQDGLRWRANWHDLTDWLEWSKRDDYRKVIFKKTEEGGLVRISGHRMDGVNNVFKKRK